MVLRYILVVCIYCLGGCGTLITQYEMKDGEPADGPIGGKIDSKIYSGTVFDAKAQLTPPGSGGNIGGLIFLIDLPLSIVIDTLILPYTAYYELTKESETIEPQQ